MGLSSHLFSPSLPPVGSKLPAVDFPQALTSENHSISGMAVTWNGLHSEGRLLSH